VASKATQWVNIGQAGRAPTEQELMCAIYQSHTIPWIVAGAGNEWMNFPTDINKNVTTCHRAQINHAVGVTGWRTGADGKVYFKMRNSWGTNWGAGGYAFMPLGCYNLGEEAAFIVSDAMPCKPPVVKLPISVTINAGDEVMISTRNLDGVSYEWSTGPCQSSIGQTHELAISPKEDTTYKVTGKNSCGTAESSVRVTLVKSSN
jgi:hypothetical protein